MGRVERFVIALMVGIAVGTGINIARAGEVAVIEKVQVIFEEPDGKGGVYRDAMNMSKEEYEASTAKSREAIQQKRVEDWKAAIESASAKADAIDEPKEDLPPCK